MNHAVRRTVQATAAVLILPMFLLTSVETQACDAAGPHAHVGQVLGVNGNHFTIRDAQSGEPIQFTVSKSTQGSMPAIGQGVAVKFSDANSGANKGLVAQSIQQLMK